MYGFLQPYEAALRAHAAVSARPGSWSSATAPPLFWTTWPGWATRLRRPLCPALPPLHTRAQLLGAMYVLEGSTLGGQVIARQLAAAGIAGRTFFTGRAERTGPLWKQFCQLLEAAAGTEDPDAIVASAILTFQTLAAWLNQP